MRFLLAVFAVFAVPSSAADNPWAKVLELKSGGEVRILKTGSPQPVLGTLDEAHEDSVVVVVRNEETAIPRDQILRLDYRPRQTGKRVTARIPVTKETRETETPPDPSAISPRDRSGPSTSESTNYSFGSKPDFQTIYRRTASMPR